MNPRSKRARPLTPKQRSALIYLSAYTKKFNVTPTRREIAGALNLSRNDPSPVLEPLRVKGFIEMVGARRQARRAIAITPLGYKQLRQQPATQAEIEELFSRPAFGPVITEGAPSLPGFG